MDPNSNTAQRWREARAGKHPEAPRPPHVPDSTRAAAATATTPRARATLAAPAASPAASPVAPALAFDPGTPPAAPEAAPVLDVEAALQEITRVPAATIHRAAAYTWASRAIASYRVCSSKVVIQEGLSYLYLGEHYREAALAHAAMGEAWQPLFHEIDQAMADDRARAFASLRNRSPVATR